MITCWNAIAALVLVLPAVARDNQTKTPCEGEVEDSHGACCSAHLLLESLEGFGECCPANLLLESPDGIRSCADQPSDMSVAVALTLILSFIFLLSLQCFMHHHDVDMREHAYTVISSTVSIFSAVLMFQSLNGVVEDLISEPLQKATGFGEEMVDLVVDTLHMLLWYTATQLTIAYVSCAMKTSQWRKMELAAAADPENHGEENVMLNIKINSACYGIVLAHLTGFAAINVWTELQQISPFKDSPLLSLVPLPIAVLVLLMLERVSEFLREIYISMHGDRDWFENMWDETCQSAEDDIMGLTLSVLIVNSLRYAINQSHDHKCLPNQEQKEKGPGCKFDHSVGQALWLLGFGLLFVIVLFLTKYVFLKLTPEEAQFKIKEGEVDLRDNPDSPLPLSLPKKKGHKKTSCHTEIREVLDRVLKGEQHQAQKPEKTCWFKFVERMEDVILTTLGMACSWCVFHGTHQFLIVINPGFLGEENNATTLAVVLALGATYISFLFIRILDLVSGVLEDYTPREVNEAIKTVISAMSIFIGFAWEQTFDESVDQLAERTRLRFGSHAPALAKVIIGGGCIGVVFCSWKWFILPFVFRKGWRFGYIFTRKDLHDRCDELAKHDAGFSFAHLQGLAHKLAVKSDEYKRRFLPQLNEDGSDYQQLAGGPLAVSEGKAMTERVQELKIHIKFLEQQLAEIRRSEVETMRTENQELKIRVRFLEQQLADERKKGEEWKVHRKFMEKQLAQARKAREDLEKSAFSDKQHAEDIKVREEREKRGKAEGDERSKADSEKRSKADEDGGQSGEQQKAAPAPPTAPAPAPDTSAVASNAPAPQPSPFPSSSASAPAPAPAFDPHHVIAFEYAPAPSAVPVGYASAAAAAPAPAPSIAPAPASAPASTLASSPAPALALPPLGFAPTVALVPRVNAPDHDVAITTPVIATLPPALPVAPTPAPALARASSPIRAPAFRSARPDAAEIPAFRSPLPDAGEPSKLQKMMFSGLTSGATSPSTPRTPRLSELVQETLKKQSEDSEARLAAQRRLMTSGAASPLTPRSTEKAQDYLKKQSEGSQRLASQFEIDRRLRTAGMASPSTPRSTQKAEENPRRQPEGTERLAAQFDIDRRFATSGFSSPSAGIGTPRSVQQAEENPRRQPEGSERLVSQFDIDRRLATSGFSSPSAPKPAGSVPENGKRPPEGSERLAMQFDFDRRLRSSPSTPRSAEKGQESLRKQPEGSEWPASYRQADGRMMNSGLASPSTPRLADKVQEQLRQQSDRSEWPGASSLEMNGTPRVDTLQREQTSESRSSSQSSSFSERSKSRKDLRTKLTPYTYNT